MIMIVDSSLYYTVSYQRKRLVEFDEEKQDGEKEPIRKNRSPQSHHTKNTRHLSI